MHTPKRTFEDLYEPVDKIGSGAFAEVYLARDKLRGGYYAAKVRTISPLPVHDTE